MMGLGSVAAGGAAVTGTGAFSFAETTRGISVNFAPDDTSLLRLEPSGKPNGAYAELNGGEINFSFDGSDPSVPGSGLNQDSVYLFDEVAHIGNQGTQPVDVQIADTVGNGFWSTNFTAYIGSNDNRQSLWPKDGKTSNFDNKLTNQSYSDLVDTGPEAVELAVGDSVALGVGFAVPDGNLGSKSEEMVIRAEDADYDNEVPDSP